MERKILSFYILPSYHLIVQWCVQQGLWVLTDTVVPVCGSNGERGHVWAARLAVWVDVGCPVLSTLATHTLTTAVLIPG